MTKTAISHASGEAQVNHMMPIGNDGNWQTKSAEPSIRFHACKAWPDARYYLALPKTLNENTPVLVSVHGISRNALEHAESFASYCNNLGWAVVAPLFTASLFPKYQQLGFARKHEHPRPDFAMNAILDEVAGLTGVRTGKVYMFGYSGGGQFVHRYGLIHPHRVIAAALGAPGWYTFPDRSAPFPRGLRFNARNARFNLEGDRALGIPTAVFVGAQDVDRDVSFNTSQKIDEQQGRTRPERGRRWIAAMAAAARRRSLDTRYEFSELEECGHCFAECISIGRLNLRALDFLIRAGAPATTPARRDGCRAASLSFLA